MTEPHPTTFVPQVSALKLGNLEGINNLADTVLSIKLRGDFRIDDENEEQMLTASVP